MISESLRLKYPNSRHCTDKSCQFTERDHEVFMAYEQKIHDMEKSGTIRTIYRMNYPEPDTRFHMWYNGKEWVELK